MINTNTITIAQMREASFMAASLVSEYLGAEPSKAPIHESNLAEELVYEFGFKKRIIAKIVAEKIPIIFLDVDGVLHDPYSESAQSLEEIVCVQQILFPDIKCSKRHKLAAIAASFPKETIENLGKILEAVSQGAVVLSTAWREGYTVAELDSILGYCRHKFFGNNVLADFIIDKTVDKISQSEENELCRGREPSEEVVGRRALKMFRDRSIKIYKWLRDHDLCDANFVVIDDRYLAGFGTEQQKGLKYNNERFVWVGNEEKGPFSLKNALSAIKILRTNPYCPFPTYNHLIKDVSKAEEQQNISDEDNPSKVK